MPVRYRGPVYEYMTGARRYGYSRLNGIHIVVSYRPKSSEQSELGPRFQNRLIQKLGHSYRSCDSRVVRVPVTDKLTVLYTVPVYCTVSKTKKKVTFIFYGYCMYHCIISRNYHLCAVIPRPYT